MFSLTNFGLKFMFGRDNARFNFSDFSAVIYFYIAYCFYPNFSITFLTTFLTTLTHLLNSLLFLEIFLN